MAIASASQTENNTGGNGQFSPLKRKSQQSTNNSFDSNIFDKQDTRMRFRNSADPIYVAYDYIDNQPLSELATSFVKESVFGFMKFVSKVVKG